MSSAKLIINYDNRKITDDSYCINATVDNLTIPYEMQKCLVIRKGSYLLDERLLRIATFDEIFVDAPPSYPLPPLPTSVIKFSSISFGTIPINTDIIITSPDWWIQYFGVSSNITVTTIDEDGTLNSALPAFGNSLNFNIESNSYVDGVANRDYTDSNLYYLANSHCSKWDNYAAATNMYQVLQLGSQVLVDSYNDDQFSILTQKVYE